MIRWCVLVSLAFSVACASQRSGRVTNPTAQSVASCANNPSQDTTVFDTTQVSRKPEVLSGPDIHYPDELRRMGQSGRVIYSLVVNADGKADLGSIKTVHADAIQFAQAGRDYMEHALFSPGCRNGQAVRVRIELPIEFKVRH